MDFVDADKSLQSELTSFATHLLHAFDAVRQRGESSAEGCEQLCALLRQRAAAERSYSKDLVKCANFDIGFEEGGLMSDAIASLKSHLINKSVQHAHFAENLINDVHAPLLEIRRNLSSQGKTMVAEVIKLQRDLKQLEEKYRKTQARYSRAYKEAVIGIAEANRMGILDNDLHVRTPEPRSSSPTGGNAEGLVIELPASGISSPAAEKEPGDISDASIHSANESDDEPTSFQANDQKDNDEKALETGTSDHTDEEAPPRDSNDTEQKEHTAIRQNTNSPSPTEQKNEQAAAKQSKLKGFGRPNMSRLSSPLASNASRRFSNAVQALGGIHKKDFTNWLIPSMDKRKEEKVQAVRNLIKSAEKMRLECIAVWEEYTKMEQQDAHQYQCILTHMQQIEEDYLKEVKDSLRKQLVLESSSLANQQYDVQMLFKVMDEIDPVQDLHIFISGRRHNAGESLKEVGPLAMFALAFPSVTSYLPSPPSEQPLGLPVSPSPPLAENVIRKVELLDKECLVEGWKAKLLDEDFLKVISSAGEDSPGLKSEPDTNSKPHIVVPAALVIKLLETDQEPYSPRKCVLQVKPEEPKPPRHRFIEILKNARSESPSTKLQEAILTDIGSELEVCLKLLQEYPRHVGAHLSVFEITRTQPEASQSQQEHVETAVQLVLEGRKIPTAEMENINQELSSCCVCECLVSSLAEKFSSQRPSPGIVYQAAVDLSTLLRIILDVALTCSRWDLALAVLLVSFQVEVTTPENASAEAEEETQTATKFTGKYLHSQFADHLIWKHDALWPAILDSVISASLKTDNLPDEVEALIIENHYNRQQELRTSQLAFWGKAMRDSGVDAAKALELVEAQVGLLESTQNLKLDENHVNFLLSYLV